MDTITDIMLKQIQDIDQRDEQQVLAELAGETLDDYIYEIPEQRNKKGEVTRKRTVKLSWLGTKEMGRAKGNISLSDPIISDFDGALRVVVKGTDLSRNFSIFGGCHQPKNQKVKTYDESGREIGFTLQEDPYCFSKALSKAQRNVVQALIPAPFMAKMIDKFLVSSGKPPLKQLPKGRTEKPRIAKEMPEYSEGQVNDFHLLEVAAYNCWHIQPAEVYKQLGCTGKADCEMTPWQAFMTLKSIYENNGV